MKKGFFLASTQRIYSRDANSLGVAYSINRTHRFQQLLPSIKAYLRTCRSCFQHAPYLSNVSYPSLRSTSRQSPAVLKKHGEVCCFRSQGGATLIELMIGVVVSLVLLAGIVGVMVRVSVSNGEVIQSARLNQEVRATMDRITKDIQRAGYVNWQNTWDDDDGDGDPKDVNDEAVVNLASLVDSNGDGSINIVDFYETAVPAMNQFGDVQLFSVSSDGSTQTACTSSCNCVLFTYDLDEDGRQGVTSSPGPNQDTSGFEQFGYRLKDGVIQTRTFSTGNTHTCNGGGWQAITQANDVEITALEFSLVWSNAIAVGNDSTVFTIAGSTPGGISTTCAPADGDGDGVLGGVDDQKCLWRRKVSVLIGSRLASDSDVELTLTNDVKVRNDFLQTQ